jgi:AAA15 family ATPase/GTPase
MINVISTQDELFKDYIFDDEDRVIKNLSQINIFIGENNSGKSRFLRGLYSINNFKYQDYEYPLTHVKKLYEEFKEDFAKAFNNFEGGNSRFEVFKNNYFGNFDLDTFLSKKMVMSCQSLLRN